MAALPDFGLSLSGGGGEGGISIPVAGMMAAAGTVNRAAGPAAGGGGGEKRVKAAAPKPTDASDGCVEDPIKPKPISRSQPQYVDEARNANIEGVVKFELRIGPDGEVIDVRILQGLGHGLDQSVLATVKTWKFNPGTRCGKPVESRYVGQIRFGLTGD
jgi:protein TonB